MNDYIINTNVEDYPIKETNRKCTDVFCAILGVSFTVSLIISTIFIYNYDHDIKTSFPSDSQGRVCGFNDVKNYPYLYFTSFPKIDKRVCVSQCPINSTANNAKLKCAPTAQIGCKFNSNPTFLVVFYDNIPQETLIGYFCTPRDKVLREKMYEDINVSQRYNFFRDLNTIIICCISSLGLSILFCICVHFFPRRMNEGTIVFGLIIITVVIVFVVWFPQQYLIIRIVVSSLLVLLLGIMTYEAYQNVKIWKYYETFLKYSSKFIVDRYLVFAYIPIFFIIIVVFVVIIALQLRSFWSSAPISSSSTSLYYQFSPGRTIFYTLIVGIQFIWGLGFIKQSFNFCISANAVDWYFIQQRKDKDYMNIFTPFKRLMTIHFGTVVACAFMNGFLSVFDYIFDLLRPSSQTTNTFYIAVYNNILKCLGDVFNLVRSDSMAYVNIAGNPYCNSSRYCELLSNQAFWTKQAQSMSRSYRICSHLLISGISAMLNFILQGKQMNLVILALVFCLSFFISTLWISVHADATEAILISFLFEEQMKQRKYGCKNNKQKDIKTEMKIFERMNLHSDLIKEVKQLVIIDQKSA